MEKITRPTKIGKSGGHWNLKVPKPLDDQLIKHCVDYKLNKSEFIRCAVGDKIKSDLKRTETPPGKESI